MASFELLQDNTLNMNPKFDAEISKLYREGRFNYHIQLSIWYEDGTFKKVHFKAGDAFEHNNFVTDLLDKHSTKPFKRVVAII